MTLYEEIVALGVPIANHESDLYVPDTPEVRAVIAKHKPASVVGFINQAPPHVGESWLDINFAYDPWWAARAK